MQAKADLTAVAEKLAVFRVIAGWSNDAVSSAENDGFTHTVARIKGDGIFDERKGGCNGNVPGGHN